MIGWQHILVALVFSVLVVVTMWWYTSHVSIPWQGVWRKELEKALDSTRQQALGIIDIPEGEWLRPHHVRVVNDYISVWYRSAQREDGKHVESADFHVKGVPGGMWVTLIDGKIVSLTRNSRKVLPESIETGANYLANQIFEQLRQAVKSGNKYEGPVRNWAE